MSEQSIQSSEGLTHFAVTVLLVDDQRIIGEAVRRMLAAESDIAFHFCSDPSQALEQARTLRPTVILQDLVMPDVDGLMLVKMYRADSATRDTPLVVLSSKEEPVIKAEAFALGANDYLVKLPDKVELIARIRHHSSSYIRLLERNEAYSALAANRQRLADEMAAAAKYLQSLLPRPVEAPIAIDWRYIPSADLGGDAFGYDWIDPDHLSMYVLDVTGHGLASALLSVSIMNVMRSRALPNTDFRVPHQVLSALNDAFPSDAYGGKFFTIWYGVYRASDRLLAWSGGGHPCSLLFDPAADVPAQLESTGPMMGMIPCDFETEQRTIAPDSRLYLYSDGAFEIEQPDGRYWPFDQFIDFMSRADSGLMDRLLAHVRQLRGSDLLDDDFSIVEARF